MRFTKGQREFLGWLRWDKWELLTDGERYVVGIYFQKNGLSENDEYYQEYKSTLNVVRNKYLPEWNQRNILVEN